MFSVKSAGEGGVQHFEVNLRALVSGETDVADFAFLFGFENRLHPALGGEDEFGIVVADHFVELQEIDGVGLQAAQ